MVAALDKLPEALAFFPVEVTPELESSPIDEQSTEVKYPLQRNLQGWL
jgi:hypothetical protein